MGWIKVGFGLQMFQLRYTITLINWRKKGQYTFFVMYICGDDTQMTDDRQADENGRSIFSYSRGHET